MIFEKHTIKDSTIVYKTKFTFIFTNLRPHKPNHLLISPINIKPRFVDLDFNELNDLFFCIKNTVQVLKQKYGDLRIGIQDGKCAGQTVFHLHVHVVPNLAGGFDENRVDRTVEEMEEEAKELRPYFEKVFES